MPKHGKSISYILLKNIFFPQSNINHQDINIPSDVFYSLVLTLIIQYVISNPKDDSTNLYKGLHRG